MIKKIFLISIIVSGYIHAAEELEFCSTAEGAHWKKSCDIVPKYRAFLKVPGVRALDTSTAEYSAVLGYDKKTSSGNFAIIKQSRATKEVFDNQEPWTAFARLPRTHHYIIGNSCGKLLLYDAQKKKLSYFLLEEKPVGRISSIVSGFERDSNILISVGESLCIYDIRTPVCVSSQGINRHPSYFSPTDKVKSVSDTTFVETGSSLSEPYGIIAFWDIRNLKQTLPNSSNRQGADLMSVVDSENLVIGERYKNTPLCILNILTGKVTKTLERTQDFNIRSIAVLSNKKIIIGTAEGILFKLEDDKSVSRIDSPFEWMSSISPYNIGFKDINCLASCGEDGFVAGSADLESGVLVCDSLAVHD